MGAWKIIMLRAMHIVEATLVKFQREVRGPLKDSTGRLALRRWNLLGWVSSGLAPGGCGPEGPG